MLIPAKPLDVLFSVLVTFPCSAAVMFMFSFAFRVTFSPLTSEPWILMSFPVALMFTSFSEATVLS